ncbi:MAG: HAMP domain-containing sensor histidine kinase [Myxococcota bacterium]
MTNLYEHSFDEAKRARLQRTLDATREVLASDDLDPAVRALLEEWHDVGSDAGVLHTEVTDLSILYNTVVEHATGVEAELMRRNAEVGQFLAGMSHEFRTPLNAIIGYCEMVLEMAEEDGLDYIAAEIRHVATAGHHMLTLTNDVLDLSKVEAGQLELVPERVDAQALVHGVVSTMGALAAHRGNAITASVEPHIEWLVIDPMRLRQCLTNLVGNACKFTENGVIRVEVVEVGKWLELRVSDTGIGMSPAQQSRLFRAFAQGAATTAREYGGTGLGLALSLQLTEAMGGTIEVESTRGVGSTFTMRLPGSTIERSPS